MGGAAGIGQIRHGGLEESVQLQGYIAQGGRQAQERWGCRGGGRGTSTPGLSPVLLPTSRRTTLAGGNEAETLGSQG